MEENKTLWEYEAKLFFPEYLSEYSELKLSEQFSDRHNRGVSDFSLTEMFDTFLDLKSSFKQKDVVAIGHELYINKKNFFVAASFVGNFETDNVKEKIDIGKAAKQINNDLRGIEELLPHFEEFDYEFFNYENPHQRNDSSHNKFIFKNKYMGSPMDAFEKLQGFKNMDPKMIKKKFLDIYETAKLIELVENEPDGEGDFDATGFYVFGDSVQELAEKVINIYKTAEKLKGD